MKIYQPIGLIGEVTISVRKNDEIIKQIKHHNTITRRLATGLVSMITEQFSTQASRMVDYIPQYIGVGNGTDENTDFNNRYNLIREYTGEFVPTSGALPYRYLVNSKEPNLAIASGEITNYASATYKAFISPDDLLDGYGITEIGLYATQFTSSLLSRVQLNGTDIVTKLAGSGIDIVWNLLIAPTDDTYRVI